MTPPAERAAFRALADALPEDWAIIEAAERAYRRDQGPGAGLLKILASLEHGPCLGAPINLYQHCLQTATRVLEAGEDDELVVVALFHDMPEAFSDNHHGLVAAQLLAPWLSPRREWLLIRHVEFQALHFANHPTRNRHERDAYRGHPDFDATAEFCARYDQNSFDPHYPTFSLDRFVPIVRRFFGGTAPAASTGFDPRI
jgi:predicted HD phosphohydrolase